jgi:hypothetical protein
MIELGRVMYKELPAGISVADTTSKTNLASV